MSLKSSISSSLKLENLGTTELITTSITEKRLESSSRASYFLKLTVHELRLKFGFFVAQAALARSKQRLLSESESEVS